jgi:hypothetical protein
LSDRHGKIFTNFLKRTGNGWFSAIQGSARADLDLGKIRYTDLLKWRREEGL